MADKLHKARPRPEPTSPQVPDLPRERFYVVRVEAWYVRRLRPDEIAKPGEAFCVHAQFADALRIELEADAQEEFLDVLTQLRSVAGYEQLKGATVGLELHEIVRLGTERV